MTDAEHDAEYIRGALAHAQRHGTPAAIAKCREHINAEHPKPDITRAAKAAIRALGGTP